MYQEKPITPFLVTVIVVGFPKHVDNPVSILLIGLTIWSCIKLNCS